MAKTLEQLVSTPEPAWPLVQQWMAEATNGVEALPGTRARGEAALLALQVTARSPMGALALESGGLLIDHGWLRVLGGGHARMQSSLTHWNGLGEGAALAIEGAMVVAHDVVGGVFAINGGAFEGDAGNVFYFSPDTLEWEDTELGYSDWLAWSLSGDLETFYENMRWPGWEKDAAALGPDEAVSIAPPLVFEEGGSVAERSRKVVPAAQLVRLHFDLAAQLAAG
jgi:hypothetical protein